MKKICINNYRYILYKNKTITYYNSNFRMYLNALQNTASYFWNTVHLNEKSNEANAVNAA